jgi:hypothetical protein
VARTPTSSTSTIRARLKAASAKLTEVGCPDLAAAVDEVLTPQGWGILRRAASAVDPSKAGEPNLAIMMSESARDGVKKAAAAAGRTIKQDVDEGFSKYLAGEFTPQAPARKIRGSGEPRVNLNTRPDSALRSRVAEKLSEDQLDLTVAHVAWSYLVTKYQVPEERAAEQAE